MRNFLFTVMFSLFCVAIGAQSYDNQTFNSPPTNPTGEVGGQQNGEQGIVPIWVDDPEYALLAEHEHQCLRCKAGRACKYREDSIERLALRYGAPYQNSVDPYYQPPVVQGVGYFNPQNYYNGTGGYIPPSGGGYCATGGYDTYGGYGGGYVIMRPSHYYNQLPRPRFKWQVGVRFGN